MQDSTTRDLLKNIDPSILREYSLTFIEPNSRLHQFAPARDGPALTSQPDLFENTMLPPTSTKIRNIMSQQLTIDNNQQGDLLDNNKSNGAHNHRLSTLTQPKAPLKNQTTDNSFRPAKDQNIKPETRDFGCQTNLDLINMEKLIECSIAMRKLQEQERKRAVITQLHYPTVNLSQHQVSTNMPRSRTTDHFQDLGFSSHKDQFPYLDQQNGQASLPDEHPDQQDQPIKPVQTMKNFNLECDEKEILNMLYRSVGNLTTIKNKLEGYKFLADPNLQH